MTCLVQTQEERLLFSYDAKRGLCYRAESERSALHVLEAEATAEFDVLSERELYAACQSRRGELLLFRREEGQWRKKVLLHSKSGEQKAHCLRLWGNLTLHFLFCVLESHGELLLICYRAESSQPTVLAKVSRAEFLVRTDPAGCLHLFYESEGDCWCRRFRCGLWDAPERIGECVPVDVLFSDTESAHFLFRRGTGLFYAPYEEDALGEPTPITVGGTEPCLLFYENQIWVLYRDRGRLYYWKNGEQAPVSMITGTETELFHLRFSESGERTLARKAYGYAAGGRINLLIAARPMREREHSFADDCRIELTKLKLRTEALEQTVRRLQSLIGG